MRVSRRDVLSVLVAAALLPLAFCHLKEGSQTSVNTVPSSESKLVVEATTASRAALRARLNINGIYVGHVSRDIRPYFGRPPGLAAEGWESFCGQEVNDTTTVFLFQGSAQYIQGYNLFVGNRKVKTSCNELLRELGKPSRVLKINRWQAAWIYEDLLMIIEVNLEKNVAANQIMIGSTDQTLLHRALLGLP